MVTPIFIKKKRRSGLINPRLTLHMFGFLAFASQSIEVFPGSHRDVTNGHHEDPIRGQRARSSMVRQCPESFGHQVAGEDRFIGLIFLTNSKDRQSKDSKFLDVKSLQLSAILCQGWTNENWLKSRFHFNFAEYSEGPGAFGVLRVMNDDLVQGERGAMVGNGFCVHLDPGQIGDMFP